MSKHKKTRQQKIIADLRRQVMATNPSPIKTENVLSTASKASVQPTTPTFSLPTNSRQFTPSLTRTTLPIVSTLYLKNDITKTGILTLAIITSQLILFFFLTHHIITIAGLSY